MTPTAITVLAILACGILGYAIGRVNGRQRVGLVAGLLLGPLGVGAMLLGVFAKPKVKPKHA